jgi:hypothetical protein
MPRLILLAAAIALGASDAKAQKWVLSYDRNVRVVTMGHGKDPAPAPTSRPERARLSLTAKGDSVMGDLTLLATEEAPERLLGTVLGTRKADTLSLTVYKPIPKQGFVATQWEALMAWMKDVMHDITPTVVKLKLTTTGDDVKGTRTVVNVDGATTDGPRPVTGKREKP